MSTLLPARQEGQANEEIRTGYHGDFSPRMGRADCSIKLTEGDGGVHWRSLKWIHAAEPEFQRRKLDLSKYSTSVIEERDSVTVVLKLIDAVEGAKGSSGSYPEIRGRNQQEESEGTAAQLSSMTMGNANWLAHAKRLDLPERRNRARVVTV